jgi:hypothetical protein
MEAEAQVEVIEASEPAEMVAVAAAQILTEPTDWVGGGAGAQDGTGGNGGSGIIILMFKSFQ